MGGQDKEHHDQGQGEDINRLAAGAHFLEGNAGPGMAVALGQGVAGQGGHGGQGLARRETGRRAAGELDGPVEVEAADVFRTAQIGGPPQGAERDHLAFGATDIEMVDIGRCPAEPGFGLEHDPVGPAELVEVVDVESAEIGLERLEYVAWRNAEGLYLVPVEVVGELGNIDTEVREQPRDRRQLSGFGQEIMGSVEEISAKSVLSPLPTRLPTLT